MTDYLYRLPLRGEQRAAAVAQQRNTPTYIQPFPHGQLMSDQRPCKLRACCIMPSRDSWGVGCGGLFTVAGFDLGATCFRAGGAARHGEATCAGVGLEVLRAAGAARTRHGEATDAAVGLDEERVRDAGTGGIFTLLRLDAGSLRWE